MGYIVYMLRCADDSLYTGITTDLSRRVAAHNSGKGAKYTRGRGPVSVVYTEDCEDRPAALRRERAIKALSREEKLKLISQREASPTEEGLSLKVIARIENDFPSKFGIPRQSGLVPELSGRIVFEEAYRNPDALRELEGFSHLWLIWGFSEVRERAWSPTVRPPRLGGNKRVGVFATRSPFRPNPIGLSAVRLLGLEEDPLLGPVLLVGGADLKNGSPIYDIKPYLPYADSIQGAEGGFTKGEWTALKVVFAEALLSKLPPEKRTALLKVLSEDPRPHYQTDSARVYGMPFGGFDIRFTVEDGVLTVQEVLPLKP